MLPVELWINVMSYLGKSSLDKLCHVIPFCDDWEVKKNLFMFQAYHHQELAILLAMRAEEFDIAKTLFLEIFREIGFNTAIRIAISLDLTEQVKDIVNNGVFVNEEHVLLAINRNNLPMVDVLVVSHQHINNAFDYALETNKFSIAESLFQKGALLQSETLYKCIMLRNYRGIEFLLSRGLKLDEGVLLKANEDANVLELLLKHGARIDYDHNEPLMHYVRTGHVDCVDVLLKHFVDVNARNDLALVLAINTRMYEMVELLVIHGANVNGRDRMPLSEALQSYCVPIVDLLIKHGARLDPRVILNYLKIDRTSKDSDAERYYRKYGSEIWLDLMKLSAESEYINEHNIAFLAWKECTTINVELATILLKDNCLYGGNEALAAALLNYGVQPDHESLQSCIRTSRLELFNMLMHHSGLLKNQIACYAYLKSAIFWNKIEFVEFLLDACLYPDDVVYLCLRDAVEGECRDIIKLILKNRQFTEEQLILLMFESLKDNNIDITMLLSRDA